MQPLGDDLLLGLGNNPGNSDGALITRTPDGSTFTTEQVLTEQGVHDLQVVGGSVFVPGTDPAYTDDWTLGNLYERSVGGVWTKRRTLPLTIHALGLWHDGSTLYVGGGMHTGDNATWRGRLLRSTDDGATWADQIDVNNYRLYDVIGHAGKLYATSYDYNGVNYLVDLLTSTDGLSWSSVISSYSGLKSRMIKFGDDLIAGGNSMLYRITPAHVISNLSITFQISPQWNVFATDDTNLYVLGSDGTIWRSDDLVNWARYTHVINAVAIVWWSGVGLMICDAGVNSQIWQA